jgi:tubulin monoglycylase TTLL3/8
MQRAVVQDLVEGHRGSFELYGADFMLGRDLRHWLLEINASPTMTPSMAITAHLCPAVQLDNLRVVLDRWVDPGAYTGGFQLIYKQGKTGIYTECTKH